MNTWFAISIIINIILALLFFFKSAINEILKEWWLDKRRKREEFIKRLVEFKRIFISFNSQNYVVMITLAQKQAASMRGEVVARSIEETYDYSSTKSAEAAHSISEFLDFLPKDIRDCYAAYIKYWTEMFRIIMDGRITKEDIMGYSERMTSLALECTNLADSMIRKNLDK